MRTLLLILLSLLAGLRNTVNSQPLLTPGNTLPPVVLSPVINAPTSQVLLPALHKPVTILAFWGTWCSPCLPEMDSLAQLQLRNPNTVQVIGISNDAVSRLQQYLQRKPSALWLASDTASYLYRQFDFNYVGQSAIIDRNQRIVALVRTDSINQQLINKVLQQQPIASSGEAGRSSQQQPTGNDADTSIGFRVQWSSYQPALSAMSKNYRGTPLEGRRISFYNLCLTTILREAWQVTPKQMVFEVPEKEVCNWSDKSSRYCFDLQVPATQKDSLYLIFRRLLHQVFPVKARPGRKQLPVYILKQIPGKGHWPASNTTPATYSFSGTGFTGKGIGIKVFADYISNEMDLPVIDETGLDGVYDIVTENALRTQSDVKAALEKLGLVLEKGIREMDVLYIYKE